jgi:NitT/TauT family transport system substrate-binding protein
MRTLFLAAAAFCGVAASPALAEDILVAQWGHSLAGANMAVALEQGLFAKAGGNITGVVAAQGGGAGVRTVLAADNKSTLGYAVTSLTAAVAAIEKGEDLKIVNIGARTTSDIVLFTKKGSPIKTIQDLKGKSVGITTPLGFSDMIVTLVVKKAGLPLDSVKRTALGSIAGALAGLDNGVVDVSHLLEPEWTIKKADYQLLFHGRELPQMVQSVGVATKALIEQHPAKVKAIVEGHRLSVRAMKANPELAAKNIVKFYDRIPLDVMTAVIKDMVAADHWSEGEFDLPAMDRMLDSLRAIGAFKGDVDWSKALDNRFLAKSS